MLSKLTKKRFFWPILVFICTIPAFSFLLKPGYYIMHDDMQPIRQLSFEQCLKDGQIPCRWSPYLGYEYGYPLFNYYPALPYAVGQVFRVLGFSFLTSIKLTAILQFIFSALFIYVFAKDIFGKLGGFLSSVFYTYAPNHALNIYVRGAMNEAWALVFLPLILFFAHRAITKNKTCYFIGLSLSLSFLMLSHNPTVLTFIPILVTFCLFWIYKSKHFRPEYFLKLALSGLFAICLSAFFTLPVLFESKLVQIETMFTNYYHYTAHFVSIFQLFISNFWGDGGSIWGPNDGMSFMVGYLHWFLPVLIVFAVVFITYKTKKIDTVYIFTTILISTGLFTTFMSHERSTFLWQLFPVIQKVQFPWRFLSLTSLFSSISIGIIPLILSKYIKLKTVVIITGTIALITFAINFNYFHPVRSGPVSDLEKFSGESWRLQTTASIYDYLPKTASMAAKKPATKFIDSINPPSDYIITGQKQGTDWLFFNLILQKDSEIIISQLAFPNFVITDNNRQINYTIDPELGRMVVNLETGNHQLYIKLKNTPIRTVGNIISLLSWLSVLVYLSLNLWKRSISKK
ncbi:MAG: glycosyltransferase family 39 protein [Candidatus Shapirobacteria bacterium]|jgi:hypothetical protein